MADKFRFNEAKKMMQKNLENTASTLGVFLEAESKARTPVDTGHLRRSITHDVDVAYPKASVFVGSNVEYDPYVEFQQAHHVPAITQNVSSINNIIKKGMSVK